MALRGWWFSALAAMSAANAGEVPASMPMGAWLSLGPEGTVQEVAWHEPASEPIRQALDFAVLGLKFKRAGTCPDRVFVTGLIKFDADGEDLVPRLTSLSAGPRKIRHLNPRYPDAALRPRVVSGQVQAQFVIGRDGQVQDVELHSGKKSEGFQASVREVLPLWLYEPESCAGVPQATTVCQAFKFGPDKIKAHLDMDVLPPCPPRLDGLEIEGHAFVAPEVDVGELRRE